MDTSKVNASQSLENSSEQPKSGLPLGVLPFAFPGVPTVRCAFTAQAAGNFSLDTAAGAPEQADIKARRMALMQSFGLSRWVELHQVHGDTLHKDPEATPLGAASSLDADGACTRDNKLPLVIKTADCQPVLLTNKQGTAVAALHVGWRGNAINFLGSGVVTFCRAYDLAPQDLLAVRGPSLGPAGAEFVNFDKEWDAYFRPWFNAEKKTMNLWQLTRHQLQAAGVLPENIFSLDMCTYTLDPFLFSFRRGHAGRQISFLWIEK